MNTDHLTALLVRRSHERGYLVEAKTNAERELRTVWLQQIEREIKQEEELLGMAPVDDSLTDAELLAELGA